MENTEESTANEMTTSSTPMGRVWLIVLISMCVTFMFSWFWHVSGMNKQLRQNNAADNAVIVNTEAVAHYRDLLKEKGKEAAIASLTTY